MTNPTQDQLQFFQKYKIPLSKVLDATGMTSPIYQKIMDDLGFIAAICVTPCQRSNHSLRDKHGHCLQCDVKPLAYAARFYAEASVYIAYSGSKKLVKIGLAGIAKERVLNLSTYSYGGATDWVLFRCWRCKNVGRVENDTHKILEDFHVDGTYLKNGSKTLCQELFDCTVDQAVEALTRAIAGVSTKIIRRLDVSSISEDETSKAEELKSHSGISNRTERWSWLGAISQESKYKIDAKMLELFYQVTAKQEQYKPPLPKNSPSANLQTTPQKNQLTIRQALANLKTPISIESLANLLTTPIDILIQQLHLAGVRVFSPQAILDQIQVEKFINSSSVNISQQCLINSLNKISSINVTSIDSYHWPASGLKPYKNQKTTTKFLIQNKRAFCLNDMGTGKTITTLWAYDFLKLTGASCRMLVVTPLSTLKVTWNKEIKTHFPHLNAVVLHGSRYERLKLLSAPADIYLINHHGLKIIADALKDRTDIDLVVIDEVAQIGRNAATELWKSHNTVCNRQTPRRVIGLTGTPTPNAPTDAWAQCRLVNPSTVPPYFNRFKDSVMRYAGPYTWVPRENATEVVRDAMQPAIRFTRDEFLDLPPCVFQTREVVMSAQQSEKYWDMWRQFETEIDGKPILAVNEVSKFTKLLQIACGVVYDAKKQAVVIEENNTRLKVLVEIIEEAVTKTIVFAPFRSVIPLLQNHLTSKGISSEAVHGGVSHSKRGDIFDRFQNDANPMVLVAHPASVSHGLTLTAANTIVWFAPIPSNDIFTQANARISRSGQKHSQFIVSIQGTPVESELYERLRNKQKLQGLLLKMIEKNTPREIILETNMDTMGQSENLMSRNETASNSKNDIASNADIAVPNGLGLATKKHEEAKPSEQNVSGHETKKLLQRVNELNEKNNLKQKMQELRKRTLARLAEQDKNPPREIPMEKLMTDPMEMAYVEEPNLAISEPLLKDSFTKEVKTITLKKDKNLLNKPCPFCGGGISKQTMICKKCVTGFPKEPENHIYDRESDNSDKDSDDV